MLNAFINMRLPRKLAAAFTVLGLLTLTLAGASYYAASRLTEVAATHVDKGQASLIALADLQFSVARSRGLMYNHVVLEDMVEMERLEQDIADGNQKMMEAIDAFEAVMKDVRPSEAGELRAAVGKLIETNERVMEISRANTTAPALAFLWSEGRRANDFANKEVAESVAETRAYSHAQGEAGDRFARNAIIVIILSSVSVAVVMFGVWNLLTRTFARPLHDLVTTTVSLAEGRQVVVPYQERTEELGDVAKAVEQFRIAAVARAKADAELADVQKLVTTEVGTGLQAVANGDLTHKITVPFPPEVDSLRTDFNASIDALRNLISGVTASSGSILNGANEIAHAAEDLARRTESNAASLEETSAAISQIDERLKASAVSASRTVVRAKEANVTVGVGRSTAEEAVQAMDRVSESAKGIDQVIEGVDKIAFQTRVLAMNAAVEAGRAGDAGRGFAVVADLVSALAMRAEEEAKRAREQLTVTQTDIVTAVDAVQRVDGALATISGGVSEVHSLVGEMAVDNQAQSAAISQISVAVGVMDQSTQKNAAMVEEASAAARNLAGEATQLSDQAGRFNVSDTGFAPRLVRMASPAAAPAGVRKAPAVTAYRSPVKPLPGGNAAVAEDWADF